MKILVCTDGSEHSQKALEEASKIAEEHHPAEVAIIHVYLPLFSKLPDGCSPQKVQEYKNLLKEQIEEKEKILADARAFLEQKNIEVSTILKKGARTAEIILKVASEEEFDTIVIGSRGLGGIKKALLGSVSTAVVRKAKNCNVVVVE